VIWIEVALRIAIGCAAFAILYVAWFVYEDEEKELQSRIEGWWLNFDDVRVSMISRQAAFVSVVARKATEVLDGVFGPRLFAKDSVEAATCFSVAGYVVIIFLSKYLEGRSDAVTWAFALAAIGLFYLWCCSASFGSVSTITASRPEREHYSWGIHVACLFDSIAVVSVI
jgi:hypothetical protein